MFDMFFCVQPKKGIQDLQVINGVMGPLQPALYMGNCFLFTAINAVMGPTTTVGSPFEGSPSWFGTAAGSSKASTAA